ncbi:E3 ubiquitin-protein ligase ZNRF1 [Pogona vitticeps]
MGGKQSTAGAAAAGRSRAGGGGGGGLAGVSSDDSAVPPPGGLSHFGQYRASGGGGGGAALGLRSRSVSSVAGVGVGLGLEGGPAGAGSVSFGLYTAGGATGSSTAAATTSGTAATTATTTTSAAAATGEAERAGSDSTPFAHGNGYQETGGGHHRDGMLYLGSTRASLADALPLHLGPRWFGSHSGFKCPICSKSVASDEMEMHFIMCLSKPRLSYNDDVLTKDAGECVICLEELLQGDTIARLPCLCIYHKSCIDSWFEVNRSCPEHPSD